MTMPSNHWVKRVPVLLSCVLLSSLLAAQEARAPQPLALTHVTVVDVRDGSLHRDQTVVIRGNRIAAVGASGSAAVLDGARLIDAEGRYLIPGLWDMHVHVFNQVSRRPPNLWHFPLFVANGVTGVREMWTKTTDTGTLAEWRARVAAGDLLAPRIAASGALVDGPRSWWPTADRVETANEARRFVQEVHRSGLHFVKVYSNLSRDAYFAIAAEARQAGLPVAGHIPLLVRATEAADAGQRSNEHLHQVLEACSTAERQILDERQRLYGRAFTAAEEDSLWNRHEGLRAETHDAATCAGVARWLAAARQWQVPTLVKARRWSFGPREPHGGDAALAYVPLAERRVWREGYGKYGVESNELASMTSSAERDEKARRWKATLSVVRTLAQNGVPLLAGTDLGGPYIYPGFSLHEELALLVEAGLSPLEALQTATLNPARYLEVTESLGTVEPGKLADLVLLDANPLDDIRNTEKIRAVALNGRFLDRRALDQLLADSETAAADEQKAHRRGIEHVTEPQPPRADRPATERALERGDFEFRDDRGRSDRPIHVWYARPKGAGTEARLVFLLHGDSRTGELARDVGAPHAARHGFIVVAPHFRQEEYPGDVYELGGMVDSSGVLQPRRDWGLLLIEHLFDHLRERWSLASTTYDIIGHSAGGQFVQRLVLFVPEARVRRAVASGPGTLAFPDENVSAPYGLAGGDVTSADLRRSLGRDFVVVVGERDINEGSRPAPVLAQGRSRVSRAFRLFAAAHEAAVALGVPLMWRLRVVPGLDHSPLETVALDFEEIVR